jgi:hypothetical protein
MRKKHQHNKSGYGIEAFIENKMLLFHTNWFLASPKEFDQNRKAWNVSTSSWFELKW